MTTPARALRQGSETAIEIYTAVGIALSWWEGSEDIIMGVFKALCGAKEPVAFDTYVRSGRAARLKMLKDALSKYPGYFTKDETADILSAIGTLNGLVQTRNQIAHGHVAKMRVESDGVLEMDGHFLVPSLNEKGQHMFRDSRYALTAAEIDEWREKVRAERAKIMDISTAAMLRYVDTHGPIQLGPISGSS